MGDEQSLKMGFWGIGPSLSTPALLCAALAGGATYVWPTWFAIHWVPYPPLLAAGVILLLVGAVLQMIAGWALMRAYHQHRLATTGVYAVCRNPLYANIILTFLPALALLCRSWLMLTASVVMYVLTRLRIHREEEYLEQRFGQEYLDYRRQTNAIFPTIRRR